MIIESLQNARVKRVLNLQKQAKYRKKETAFVVEGKREIERALKSGFECLEWWYQKNHLPDTEFPAEALQIECSQSVFEKITYREASAGAIAIFRIQTVELADYRLPKNALIAVLEGIEKPGNIGAVIRTCNGLGVDAIFLCDSQVDLFNPNIIRNSLGGFFDIPLISTSTEKAIAYFKEKSVQIITTHLEASIDYTDVNFKETTAIVFGSEAKGISHAWVKSTNQNVIVRMFGVVDSLNISVAAAIVLSEAVRQRKIG